MPTSTEDARRVQDHVDRIFNAAPRDRAEAIRRLFVEVLDFHGAAGPVSLAGAKGAELPNFAERIASLDGVQVLWVALATKRVNKREAAEAALLIERDLGEDLLLVFTNGDASQLHLILPDFTSGTVPKLRRRTVERGLPQRTAYEQIAGIYSEDDPLPVRQALKKAFDVEPVTRDFFRKYDELFKAAKGLVTGLEGEERHLFVQTLFNRLLFVHFLSRKGWLTFEDDKDYLKALWRDYQATDGETNFHRDRLRRLFFDGLSNPESRFRDYPDIGKVQFLNGGLFERTDLDRREGVIVPDAAIEPLLSELFDRFNFTVMESTPLDVEVAVDPEMLGKVFEETLLRHERGEDGPDVRRASGTYYTPREVVGFMCREALKQYLDARDTGLAAEAIAAFVDKRDTEAIGVAEARKVAAALSEVTVVDPACGSGAYLLGMMQELVDLQRRLFNAGADEKKLHQLKLEIIERNLRGADLDPFAVHIAQLRLWLSLTIEYEGERPRPLPNLDLTIVTGDSLLAAHTGEGGVQGVFGDEAGELRDLKSRYLGTSAGPAKAALRAQIAELNRDLRERFGGSGAADAGDGVEWRSAFAEIFEPLDGRGGGFDIVIANPPYRQLQRDSGRLADLYSKAGYRTFARTGDIYQLFYERGCELLRPESGILAYITSNSWLRAEYGKKLRRFLAERHTPLRWLDLGKDVFDSAIVDSGVLLLRTGGDKSGAFPAVDMDNVRGESFPPAEEDWGHVRPDADAPWSVLSDVEWNVMDKMHSIGTPLKDWDIAINYGVKTGLNEAFIIDNETKDALVAQDPRSAEILKPVLRGRDIQRYQADWAGMWLIDTHNGHDDVPAIEIDDYPAIKAFLDRHSEKLAKRYDRGRTPYNLRNCAYHATFARPKLFWMDMSPEGRFAYDEGEMYCNNKGYILSGGPLKYMCAVLNSRLVTWLMGNSARTTGLGLLQWERFSVGRIPIPRIPEAERGPLVDLVDCILEAKAADTDTAALEGESDHLVYDLYGLSREERSAVEESLT